MLGFYKNNNNKESGNLLIPLLFLITLPILVILAVSKQSQDIKSKASENRTGLSVIQEIPVDRGPLALVVNEEDNKIYVGNNDGTDATTVGSAGGGQGNFAVIDGNNYQTQFIRNGAVVHPLGAAYNPQTHKLYFTNNDNDEQGGWLTIVDTNNINLFKKTRVGGVPRGIAINKRTNKIFIANNDNPWRSISVVDGNSDQEIQKISVPGIPAEVAVDEELNRVYVTNWDEGHDEVQLITAIDGDDYHTIWSKTIQNTASRHRTKGVTPYDIAVNPQTHDLYVTANSGVGESGLSGYLYLLSSEGIVKDEKMLGERASGIVYNPTSKRIFVSVIVASARDYRIFVLKDNSGKLQEENPIQIPWLSDSGLAINTKTGQLFVGILGDEKKVVVIQDTASSSEATNDDSNAVSDSITTSSSDTANGWNSERCALYKNNGSLEADCVNYGDGSDMSKWCSCAKRCVGKNAIYGNKVYNSANFPQCAPYITNP